jgi:hypothetical protein
VRGLSEGLTYGNVTATLALFVALGGTSYAVAQLPRNSVGSAQLKRSAVSAADIKRGAVTSRAIRDRAVALRHISSGARAGLKGDKGDPGPAGVAFSGYAPGGWVVSGRGALWSRRDAAAAANRTSFRGSTKETRLRSARIAGCAVVAPERGESVARAPTLKQDA